MTTPAVDVALPPTIVSPELAEVLGKSELPEGWTECEMRDISQVVGGGTPKANDPTNFSGDGHPWITPADMSNHRGMHIGGGRRSLSNKGINTSSATLLPAGAVLFSSRAPIGYVAIASRPVSTNQGFRSFVLASGILPEYVYFYLRFAKPLAERLASGTTFLEISGTNAGRIPILVPPLTEQRRIVAQVEALLARTTAARERLAKVPAILKRFRQTVLAAACSGHLTEDWREARDEIEPASSLLDRLRSNGELATVIGRRRNSGAEWTPPLVAENQTEEKLPQTWAWASIGDIADIQNGRAFPSSEYGPIGIRLLRPGNLHGGGGLVWTEANTACLPIEWAARYPDYVLRQGELVINLTAQSLKDEFLGRVCIKRDAERALLNQRIGRFIMRGEDIRPFLYVYLKSPRFRSYVNTLDTGSLIRHMHSKQILVHRLPLPPLIEQHEIVRRVDALFALANKIEQCVAAATLRTEKLTQAVLAKAFRGELVPTEAELARLEGRGYEPASELLERIRRERAAPTRVKQSRTQRLHTPNM